MRMIEEALKKNPQVTDYKINVHKKDSYELFFVKGKLETVRCTDTCDKDVTVYVSHGEFLGDTQFPVYPSTTAQELDALIAEAVGKAILINNQSYTLPEGETCCEDTSDPFSPEELAAKVANTVFGANRVENGSLNSVEVFINRHVETVANSRGLCKTQTRFDAMVEAIPTYNGETQSVELYEQYNFGSFREEDLANEIAGMMQAVKARYEAVKPETAPSCKVILNKLELEQLFKDIVRNLNYSSVYAHASVFAKGDEIQKDPVGDKITITMAGQSEGNLASSRFDSDGLSLGTMTVVMDGKAVNYYGSNRFGQYLGETPTGNLGCLCVEPGTADSADFAEGPYLEAISMSGLQVDFFKDYIGGEVRLAYYHDGETITPVTGLSISGKVSQVLSSIRLSKAAGFHDSYQGPEKAILTGMAIF